MKFFSNQPSSQNSRVKWHLLFYILAAFDLCTVLVSLAINHNLQRLYKDSVAINQVWGERLSAYSDLGLLVADVNAPGNDVFDSGDAPTESARMRSALQLFSTRLNQLRDEVQLEPDKQAAQRINEDFTTIEAKVAEMVGEAERIFSYFEQNQADLAGQRMATMDRRYAEVNRALASLREHVSGVQRQHFEVQEMQAGRIARFEYLIAGLVLAMMAAATVYGRFLANKMDRAMTAELKAERLAADQQALQESEERLQALVGNAQDLIVIVATEGTMSYVSPAAEQMWGVTPETLRGQNFLERVHPDDVAAAHHLLAQALTKPGVNVTSEVRLRRADDTWRDAEIVANNLQGNARVAGIVITCHDITERKAHEQELTHLAFRDRLSNLPNRALFLDRLSQALERSQRQQQQVAVMFLDMDNFKVINDSLGHQVGDHFIVAVAERLRQCLRGEDTIARFGGDEFTVFVEDIATEGDAIAVAERISEALHAPLRLAGHDIFPSVSVGIALSGQIEGIKRPGDLLRNADLAMYQAKNSGKGRLALFTTDMTDIAVNRLNAEAELRQALKNGEFRLHYQPVVSLQTGELCGMEALVRWERDGKLMPPAQFIPIAEETGLIVPLGQWVLNEACQQAKRWQEKCVNTAPLAVSVNLSPRQFAHLNLLEDVSQALATSGLEAGYLKLEITEGTIMKDVVAAAITLEKLRDLGVSISIDDFGTGYSSLSYLKQFPVDELKIDRSFIDGLGLNRSDTAIVRMVIDLGSNLNLGVTAEGIETEQHVDLLKTMGCDHGQGYYFSKPVPTEAFGKLLVDKGLWIEHPEQPVTQPSTPYDPLQKN